MFFLKGLKSKPKIFLPHFDANCKISRITAFVLITFRSLISEYYVKISSEKESRQDQHEIVLFDSFFFKKRAVFYYIQSLTQTKLHQTDV